MLEVERLRHLRSTAVHGVTGSRGHGVTEGIGRWLFQDKFLYQYHVDVNNAVKLPKVLFLLAPFAVILMKANPWPSNVIPSSI